MHLKKRVVVVKCEEAAADRAIAFSDVSSASEPMSDLGVALPSCRLAESHGDFASYNPK